MRREQVRDAGLLRLSTSTRLLAAGAFVSAGVFSVGVAKALPGHSAATAPATSAPPTTAAPLTAGGDDGSATYQTPQTLTPPTAPPQPVYNPPVVSSGGS
ncbi:MAG: hypothetical protein KGQ66_18545 [Acidobacteriota bacterium]|nr:hypothetical protein [Acidobacteriota bacterium]